MEFKRGQIILMDWFKREESPVEIDGIRPALIISNNKGNKFSTIFSCLPLVDKLEKEKFKVYVPLSKDHYPVLKKDTFIIIEQLRTLDRRRIKAVEPKTYLKEDDMEKVNECLMKHVGILSSSSNELVISDN